jgi:digeranylgeranylglycerophospholipid reductase
LRHIWVNFSKRIKQKQTKNINLVRKKDLLEFSFNTLGSFMNLKDFDLTDDVVAQEIDTITFRSKTF